MNQRDLALGVAYACLAIQDDPNEAATLTSRANLVAVLTNGSAVLGLGNFGALAGKPVMEGKGYLFKRFAGIDVFDIEVNESDPDGLIEIMMSRLTFATSSEPGKTAQFLDAANISYNLLRVAASGGVTSVGPILLGAGKPVHILTQTATVRGILNMTALAAVDATQINAEATTKPAAM